MNSSDLMHCIIVCTLFVVVGVTIVLWKYFDEKNYRR